MMRFFLTIILFCFCWGVFPQSGTVTYKVAPKEIKISETSSAITIEVAEALKNLEKFILSFNPHMSSFLRENEGMEVEEDKDFYIRKNAYGMAGYVVAYFDIDKNTLYTERGGRLVFEENPKRDWVILDETKTINQFKVFKAELTETYYNRVNQLKERVITAWFCPELPYRLGPLTYGGLPGLILELDYRGNVYTAENITIDKSKDIKITLPKLKHISAEERAKELQLQFSK